MKKRYLQTFSLVPKLIGLAFAFSTVSCISYEDEDPWENPKITNDQEFPTMTLKAVTPEIKNGQTITDNPSSSSLLVWELRITAGVADIADYESRITLERFVNEDYTTLDPSKSGTCFLCLARSLPGVNQLKKGDKKQIVYAAVFSEIKTSKSMKVQWGIQHKSGATVVSPVEVRWTVAA